MILIQRLYPILSYTSMFFSLSKIIRKSEQPLFLPFYHTVSNEVLPHLSNLYPIRTIATFEKDLDFLLKHFKPVGIHEVLDHVQGKKRIQKPSFHLTFDDGMSECFYIIAPILKEKGISASFFVNNRFVDNQDLFYKHQVSLLIHYAKNYPQNSDALASIKATLMDAQLFSHSIVQSLKAIKQPQQLILSKIAGVLNIDFQQFLAQQRPYMTTSEILQLQKDGFHIGGHSVDHPNYADIDFKTQIRQTTESLDFVKAQFDNDIRSFAFPFSSNMLTNAFFYAMNSKMDISFGTSGLKIDPFTNHLHRFPMEGTNYTASTLTKAAYFYFLIKRILRKEVLIRH
jgi:peptidoglycan/xylan/chitin deacetylase (PgdA/CDA1 family)